ncbi:MAG: hypothetical protein S4CHLAM6_15670 [Chlamydiae bacterium]|nr:hypothetical protein [Chlamydiota bacterium]
MTKQKVVPLDPSVDEENKFVAKLLKNRKLMLNILYGFILLGLTIGLINKKVNQSKMRNMSVAYASLDDQSALEPKADLKLVKKIASKHTFLQAHLDGPLAQEFINQGDYKSSKMLNKRIQTRLAPNLNIISKFNQVTFLISENNHKEALVLSNQLHEEIDAEKMPFLYAYHLLRMANLEKILNNNESYQKHLQEFSVCKANVNHDDVLKLGQLSLKDYIAKGPSLR